MSPDERLRPICIETVRAGEEVRLKRPLILLPRIENGLVVIEHERFGVSVVARSLDEAREVLEEQVALIWSTFVEARDEDLPEPSLAIKRNWEPLCREITSFGDLYGIFAGGVQATEEDIDEALYTFEWEDGDAPCP